MAEAIEFEDTAQVMNFQSADTAEALSRVRREARPDVHRTLGRRHLIGADRRTFDLGHANGVPVGLRDPAARARRALPTRPPHEVQVSSIEPPEYASASIGVPS